MSLSVAEIRETLLERDAEEDNPWSVWLGSDPNTATQILNLDDSNPYIRQTDVTTEMLAFDTSLKLNTTVYRMTWVSDLEPDANATYWLSSNGGLTKNRIAFSYRQSKVKRAYWWVFLKDG